MEGYDDADDFISDGFAKELKQIADKARKNRDSPRS
jgi:hypothetical protein